MCVGMCCAACQLPPAVMSALSLGLAGVALLINELQESNVRDSRPSEDDSPTPHIKINISTQYHEEMPIGDTLRLGRRREETGRGLILLKLVPARSMQFAARENSTLKWSDIRGQLGLFVDRILRGHWAGLSAAEYSVLCLCLCVFLPFPDPDSPDISTRI